MTSAPDYDEEAEPLVNIATGLHRLAHAVRLIAHGDQGAGSQPTGLEMVAMELKEGLKSVAIAISENPGSFIDEDT